MIYVGAEDVERICRELDPAAIVRDALILHERGESDLPPETSLRWTTAGGVSARSLNMRGALGGAFGRGGTKIINASLANGRRGVPRASGVALLFDTETAHRGDHWASHPDRR